MVEKKHNSQGQVAVLFSFGYGKGWSTLLHKNEIQMRREMMMNKNLVEYVMNCRENGKIVTASEMRKLWLEVLPEYPVPDLGGVPQLNVMWVNKNQAFQIRDMKGAEYIYCPHDDPSWEIA